MKHLHVGAPGSAFTLPAAELVTQTLVVYGGKGMGKTNLIAVIAEELAAAGRRFALLDPVGVSWGLRHDADGKGAGIDVLILGGRHGDLPIDPTAGSLVADFVADEEQNVIIDVSRRADGQMWGAGEKIRFVADYMSRLYQRQGERRRPVLQIVDEAGRFVPQNPPKGADDIARCIGAIEQLVELGRNVGVGVMLVTQRSARMAKSVSELAECMIAFRTVGPRSVDAILDWFGEHVEKSRRPALLEQLRQLPRGRALVVSPGWLEYEDAVTFRARRTFDSSATPTEAERRMVKLAPAPDRLEAFRTKLAETVDRAKRDDPRELRKALAAAEKTAAQYANTIAQLEKTVAALRAKPVQASPAPLRPRTDRELAAVARLKDRFTERVTRLETAFHADVTAMLELGRQIARLEQQLLARLTAAPPVKAAQPVPATSRVPGITESVNHSPQPRLVNHEVAPAWVTAGPDSSLLDSRQQPKKHVRRLLTVLAQHAPRRFKRDAWYRLSGYKPSGDISTAVAALLERRFVTDDAGFGITVAGLELLGPFEPLPVGAALREHLLQKSSTLERRLLGVWFSAYPSALTRTEAFAAAQYKPSGDTSTAVAKFLTVGWLDDLGGGKLRASEDFYA